MKFKAHFCFSFGTEELRCTSLTLFSIFMQNGDVNLSEENAGETSVLNEVLQPKVARI